MRRKSTGWLLALVLCMGCGSEEGSGVSGEETGQDVVETGDACDG